MDNEHFEKSVSVPVSAEELYAWHMKPGAFARITPPWERFEILEEPPEIKNGRTTTVRVKTGPFWIPLIVEYRFVREGKEFTDVQVKGLFQTWQHRHRCINKGKSSSVLVDSIEYRLPLGFVGRFLGGRFVVKKLEKLFRYRHRITQDDICRDKETPEVQPMTILVTGASGLLGGAMIPRFEHLGHRIVRVSRSAEDDASDMVKWDPMDGDLDLANAGSIDAVIHLAGENIAGGRWTKKRKDRIFYSRKKGTRLLAEKLAKLENPPKVLITASGINYYESTSLNTHTEDSPIGTSFLSEVCREWEDQTRPAKEAGIRTIHLRLGVVLSPAGGALKKMLLPFKMYGGGRVGHGRQRISWIAIDDVTEIVLECLRNEELEGPVNAVSPQIVDSREFAKTLGRVLRRPALLPAPEAVLKLLFGELAEEALLADLAVAPAKLREIGYKFRFRNLDDALRHLLGKP